MEYKLTTKQEKLVVSLSRTGGQGSAGVSVTNANVDGTGHLIITLSNGTTIDAGFVGGGVSGLKPLAYSASLSDMLSGDLTVGTIQGGTF